MTPFEETIAAQRAAAAPKVSAFVAANAGAGKTRVLTDRVARLLLAGARPDQVLCITFTKAAAAEMAARLFKLLGEWALADDKTLAAALAALDGESADRDLATARRLFARALETPGGLKIQTIHSFCESVLKRFPIEAGVAPGFSVIEEAEAAALVQSAIDIAAKRSLHDPQLGAAMRRLLARRSPGEVRDILAGRLSSHQETINAVAACGGWGGLKRAICEALGLKPQDCEESLLAQAAAALSGADLEALQSALLSGGKTAIKMANESLPLALNARSDDEKFAALCAIFLTQKGTPRASILDKPAKAAAPWLEERCDRWRQAIADHLDSLRRVRARADTEALLVLLEVAHDAYCQMKAARAALDYDDLIERARLLFSDSDQAAWALYKLDQGIEHILLDEAQDTSPSQWSVVEGPLTEFFAGVGAHQRARTFFAVGDQKQSIYSFQGADASLFKAKRVDIGKKIAAVADFVERPLQLSFRTTAPVLRFVDALFEDAEAREGLGEDGPVHHKIIREGEAGLVELWPLTPRPDKADPAPWDAPLDSTPDKNPVRDLAGAVAQTIAGWIASQETLASQGRPISAGDILILVQSRSALFHEVIRALARARVPVAGADRLRLLEDAAVEDLLAYARVCLLRKDDLSLAETLKCPLFGFTDDDLLELTRDSNASLWRRLKARAHEKPHWKRAVDEIDAARKIALRDGAYAFFSHVLETGAPSGRRRLFSRLGEPSGETLGELLRLALDFEMGRPRSLQAFLAWIQTHAGEIKRQTDQESGAVRVMTVHGAKGLEAPIVFLLDTHKLPNLSVGPVLKLRGDGRKSSPAGLFVLAGLKDEDPAIVRNARDQEIRLQYEEYRRMLYVAATRARDRLYICGLESSNVKNPEARATAQKSWHALSTDAFARLDDACRAPHPEGWGEILRYECAQTKPAAANTPHPATKTAPLPAFLQSPARIERAVQRLAPSQLADYDEAASDPAYSPLGAKDRFLRGRVLHRLLELLPGVEQDARAAAADRLLARLAPDIDPSERGAWREEALRVLSDPAFAPVFAAGSRAEVAISGAPRGARSGVIISGAIDRLAVTPDRVLIVDYKTNRPPPARIEHASPAYLAQLAAYRALLQEIYPHHQIECALLWTYDARLMHAPSELLDHAFSTSLA